MANVAVALQPYQLLLSTNLRETFAESRCQHNVHLAGDGGGGAQAGPHHRRPPVPGLVLALRRVCNMGGSLNT